MHNLLCKHLVRLVDLPSSRFWGQISKTRFTEGDDHIWTGDVEVLKGGGGWKELRKKAGNATRIASSGASKKRLHNNGPETSQQLELHTPAIKRARTCEVIDLTNSSPAPEDAPITINDPIPPRSSSPPQDYATGHEDKMDIWHEAIMSKARAFEKAAKILLDPSFHPEPVMMKFLAEGKFGNDVVDWVKNIEHVAKNGRKRDTTWGIRKGKTERRRVRNTMGYKLRQSPTESSGS
ncbi:hypothetical protein H0H87_002932 [Tephrocybe sp. NHM501043]|nr:hypothetical protein H0H87_002932 [Tephrocybe sp. NHM501043]